MAKTIYYGITDGKQWLQDIVPNEHYCPSAKAPTMGARHDVSEFKSVWGNAPKKFERLTALNRIKVIMEEQRWEDTGIYPIEVVPVTEE